MNKDHRRPGQRSLTLLLAALLLTSSLVLVWQRAEANGAPVRVVLSYMPDVSNWGPTNATGVAEITWAEGEAKITVAGLPKLDADTYEAWLLNTSTKESLSLGRFNTLDNSTAQMDNILPSAIKDVGYDIVLLTVENKGPAAAKPSDKHSIAGKVIHTTGTGTGVLPSGLPRTGGTFDMKVFLIGGLVLLSAGLALRKLASRGGGS